MAAILLEYYNNEISNVIHHMSMVEDKYSEHYIHKVRVGIKRIKAVNRMLESSFTGIVQAKSLNKPFKKVFRSLGPYREAQINVKLVGKLMWPGKLKKACRRYLKLLMSEMKDDIGVAISSFEYNPESDEVIQVVDILENLTIDREIQLLTSYIENQRLKALAILSESEGYNQLHAIRIILKNMKPLLGLLSAQDLSRCSKKDYKRLNKTESIIGKWHDKYVLNLSLQEFSQHYIGENDYGHRAFERITNRIRKKEARQVSKIRTRLASLLNSLSPPD